MQLAKVKASSFPYRVALAIILVNLILDAFSIYRMQHMPNVMAGGAAAMHMMYLVYGGQWVGMVFAATVGMAYAQGLMERRQADLPWYGIVGAAIGYGVLAVALNYGWLSVQTAAVTRAGYAGAQVLIIVGAFVIRVITLIAIMLPLWLGYRIVPQRQASAGEMRWRSLLIFASLAWAWHLILVQLVLPATLAAASVYDLDLWSMSPWIYAGSLTLVLPIGFAALLGWPASMPSARVSRVVLASFLTTIINLVCMFAVAIVAASVISHRAADDIAMATGPALIAALVWFVIALPLCWLCVKGLMRSSPRHMSVEQGYRFEVG